MTDRAAQIDAFLRHVGWGGAVRSALAGDASARRYDRLRRGAKTAVLMDAPAEQSEEMSAFVRVASHLATMGLSAPRILAQDQAAGLLLLEDLGDGLYARLSDQNPAQEGPIYAAAVDVLVRLAEGPPAQDLPNPSATDWAAAAAFAPDWYARAITGAKPDTTAFLTALEAALVAHADGPRVMILRDYHAENLLWLPQRPGLARVGLLDFQMAQLGQLGYDLVSLCQDARRDVSRQTEAAMIRRFLDTSGHNAASFEVAYAVLGAQRALRILGIFTRLSLVMGKPGYVDLIPRVWGQLQRNLSHPALAPLAAVCATLLPEPTKVRLERIRAQCGSHRP